VAAGVDRLLPVDDRGVVRDEVAADLEWVPAELAPGDVVVIDGLAPHYSEANHTDGPRRVFVASYAPAHEHYGRDRYYAARAEAMRDGPAGRGRARISAIADFEGTEASPPGAAVVTTCTHPRPTVP
jgi:hypothetical protein